MITQRGMIIGPSDLHTLLAKTLQRAYDITSFTNDASPKTWDKLRDIMYKHGYLYESTAFFSSENDGKIVFALYVYRTEAERLACFQFTAKQSKGN